MGILIFRYSDSAFMRAVFVLLAKWLISVVMALLCRRISGDLILCILRHLFMWLIVCYDEYSIRV